MILAGTANRNLSEDLQMMKYHANDRLQQFGIEAKVLLSTGAIALGDRPWLAMTSSHLGKSTQLHAEVCRYISRSMIDARQTGSVLLIATGSAIEPWAKRAADLLSVPTIQVHVGESTDQNPENDPGARIDILSPKSHSRDAVVIALADRVDCVFIRPKGNIESSLRMRLDQQLDSSVRIAVHLSSVEQRSQRIARALMGRGAVGWYCRPFASEDGVKSKGVSIAANNWATSNDEWLVHCTRGCSGPWPGQTERQHQDELLLGVATVATAEKRTPLNSLCRILKKRRLIGSALASDRDWPVVCFSEHPLAGLLAQRRYRSHLHRWDYEPYGIAIRKSAAIEAGFQSVVYGDREAREKLSTSDRYRFQSSGKTFDWTQEREWRCAGDVDLEQFNPRDIQLFVRDESDANQIDCPFAVSVVGEYIR